MNESTTPLQQFQSEVGLKFQLYNSLFTSLPFHRIEKTGILLALFLTHCEEGFARGLSPVQLVDDFFKNHTTLKTDGEKLDMLFRFVQYAERQVVLFDALEDSAFAKTHDMSGPGTLKHLQTQVVQEGLIHVLAEKLKHYAIRMVLTAHPTQFYPGEVLGIINDLSKALQADNTAQVNIYLQQLGKTPFFKQEKPTPYDEAVSLIWYLENVFYHAAGRMRSFLKGQLKEAISHDNSIIQMGFWPGGDRDGNPFVSVDTTIRVADALRTGILKCYYLDVRKLRRRLTFKGVTKPLADLESRLYENVFIPGKRTLLSQEELIKTLLGIKKTLRSEHNGLFMGLVDNLISKIEVFGLHFASLDIRQDSSVHVAMYDRMATVPGLLPDGFANMDEDQKLDGLSQLRPLQDNDNALKDAVHIDTFSIPGAIRKIHEFNGPMGCQRYIISQCNSAVNVMEVYGLFLLNGFAQEEIPVDIVPLFETISDLRQAGPVMEKLYNLPAYRAHLARRGDRQTIMLGFSDGTKDGGYLMANWSIYKAKEELTAISRHYDIEVVFFDGRGGPPSRGGGKTHKFYASLGQNIANNEIQLTIQGQTVSSNFGTIDAAQFNMEQLMNAGISNSMFSSRLTTLEKHEESVLSEMASNSFDAYVELRNTPGFMDYLTHTSPLRFYGETNIGSRPAKRGGSAKLTLKDLRAIPYVGSWSQLKQNVTGYYGVGTALKQMEDAGRWKEVADLYQNSLFFKTLMDNCEMAMTKCFFPLTAHLADSPLYGAIWNKIHNEYELSRRMVLQLSGHAELMEDYPLERMSVLMRERIVLPLTTIQQYAISRLRYMEEQVMDLPVKPKFEKLVMRCSFGIINAGRNSA
ncbi:MAG TPA: phosphoenolpyruvate carboxylase [Phnomibacter sp.]|nr:phosphoenolpyruvate carboxylase [Phnomibacter sp.]